MFVERKITRKLFAERLCNFGWMLWPTHWSWVSVQ